MASGVWSTRPAGLACLGWIGYGWSDRDGWARVAEPPDSRKERRKVATCSRRRRCVRPPLLAVGGVVDTWT